MNVLLISSCEDIALTVMALLGGNGHRPHVLSIWPSARQARLSRHCAGYAVHVLRSLSPVDADPFLALVARYCLVHRIEMIVPTGWWGTFAVATLKSHLQVRFVFPVAGAAQLYRLHNKWQLFQDLQASALPVPPTRLLTAGPPLSPAGVSLPAVVKPLTKGGSIGVAVCRSLAEVEARRERSVPGSLLLQDWRPGLDAVFGVFAVDGEVKAWTLHRKGPDHLTFFNDPRIVADVRAIVRARHFTGLGNFDLRYDEVDQSYWFLECNPRVWASIGISAWYGVDFVAIGMLVAQGLAIPETMRTSVTNSAVLPNPDITRFIKDVLRGRHSLRLGGRAWPWRVMTDPLPLLLERLTRRAVAQVIDDTDQVEAAATPT